MKTKLLLDELKKTISRLVSDIFTIDGIAVEINIPTDKSKADLVSNLAFNISKLNKKSPIIIAEIIVAQLNNIKIISDFFIFDYAIVGFINIKLTDKFLNLLVEDVLINKTSFAQNDSLSGQTWVIEHTSPNPNKAMHIGHLRNNLIGMSLCKLIKFSGANVVSEAVDNDRGIAIAKAMYGYIIAKNKYNQTHDIHYWNKNQDQWLTPEEVGEKDDHFVGQCYLIGNNAFKENVNDEKEIRNYALLWENHDSEILQLWKLIISFAHKGINQTLKKLGNHWDKVWHEHDHYNAGKQIILDGVKKGIFNVINEGAVLTNLEKYLIPDTILLKSDGTTLYITQDIALTKLKKETYKATKLIWVIGPEQSLAMRQLFACCEQLGIGKLNDFEHVTYGIVNVVDESGKVKKMSSRGGEAILIDDFIDEIKNKLSDSDRGYSIDDVEKIALAVIKYSILKTSRNSSVVMDLNKSTSFNGDSGLYLLYTHARMRSLVSKWNNKVKHSDYAFKANERKIIIELLYLPIIIKNCLKDLSPNLIAEYVMELSHAFNALYSQERFITEDLTESSKKIYITEALAIMMETAFELLGINIPEKV